MEKWREERPREIAWGNKREGDGRERGGGRRGGGGEETS